jgi:hypothetical protein
MHGVTDDDPECERATREEIPRSVTTALDAGQVASARNSSNQQALQPDAAL